MIMDLDAERAAHPAGRAIARVPEQVTQAEKALRRLEQRVMSEAPVDTRSRYDGRCQDPRRDVARLGVGRTRPGAGAFVEGDERRRTTTGPCVAVEDPAEPPRYPPVARR